MCICQSQETESRDSSTVKWKRCTCPTVAWLFQLDASQPQTHTVLPDQKPSSKHARFFIFWRVFLPVGRIQCHPDMKIVESRAQKVTCFYYNIFVFKILQWTSYYGLGRGGGGPNGNISGYFRTDDLLMVAWPFLKCMYVCFFINCYSTKFTSQMWDV